MTPHTIIPRAETVMDTLVDAISQLCNTCRWPSLAWRQHLFSSLNTTWHHLVSQVTSCNNTIDVYNCAFHLWHRNLTNCTGAYTPALNKWFWKVMLLPLGPHLLLVMLWVPWDVTFQCNDLAECLNKAAIQNLVYMCRNIHLNTVAKIKVQLMHHIQQTQPFSKMTIKPLEVPQCNYSQTALIKLRVYVNFYCLTPLCIGLFRSNKPYCNMCHNLNLRHRLCTMWVLLCYKKVKYWKFHIFYFLSCKCCTQVKTRVLQSFSVSVME